MRLILMSATPMFNKSSEIVWLLNMLLKNDNRPGINEKDLFNDGVLNQELLIKKCRGYVSRNARLKKIQNYSRLLHQKQNQFTMLLFSETSKP